MPELDESIVNWRERIAGGGAIDPQTLEELESHLRDEVAALCAAGVPGEGAFDAAAWRIGMPGALQRELSKVRFAWLPISSVNYGWLAMTASVPLLMLVKYTPGRVGPVLMAHILTITAGYLGAIMIGIMGAVFALFRQAGAMSPAREQA